MTKQDLINIKENARVYAFLNARRKRLENYKKIVLNRLMKEISSSEKLNIANQKALAIKAPEYKNLLISIREHHSSEMKSLWSLNKFIAESETYVTKSSFDRANNWNIHNI